MLAALAVPEIPDVGFTGTLEGITYRSLLYQKSICLNLHGEDVFDR